MVIQALELAAIPSLAFMLVALAVPVMKVLSGLCGVMSDPAFGSPSNVATPVLGGVATIGAILAALAIMRELPAWLFFGTAGLFAIGLVDDIVALPPLWKFLLQIPPVVTVISLGPGLGLTPWPLISGTLAGFFLLSSVNAFNLIDGLDGLAAGVGIIAALACSAVGMMHGDIELTSVGLAIVGAFGGFLLHNLHPASIFMGDCGALPLGLLIGAISLQSGDLAATTSRLLRYVFPILITMAPLLDTTIVSVTRLATGRPVSRRGLDHSHHRLLALGLSQPCAVKVVWSAEALTGGCAVLLAIISHAYVVVTLPLITLILGLIGLFMIDLTFDSQPPAVAYAKVQGLARLILNFSYKRRVVDVVLDVLLIATSYFGAWLIRLDFRVDDSLIVILLSGLPWVVGVTYAAFFVAGVYRGIWRYAGLADVIRFGNAAMLAGILVLAASFVLPIPQSGSISVLFAMLLFNLLVASRLSFRALRKAIALLAVPGDRVLIIGAGETAEAAARYLTSGRNRNQRLVGFIDDDNFKLGKVVHGYAVLGSLPDLEVVYARTNFNQILVATDSLMNELMIRLSTFANLHGLPVRHFSIRVNDLIAHPDLGVKLERHDVAQRNGPAPAITPPVGA